MARSVREIDRNDDKYVGIRFPLDHSPEGFFYKTKTVLEQSKANLQNLSKKMLEPVEQNGGGFDVRVFPEVFE